MPAGRRSVAIRIGVEGDADVRNAFTRIGDAGDAQARRIGQRFDREMQSVEAAVERANRTAERLSAVSNSPQASINRVTGVGSSDAANGAAMRSAQALAQELDRAEQEARQLIAAIDPLFAAQSRYGDQVARIEALRATGAISEANYIRLLGAEEAALAQATMAAQRHAGVSGMMRAGQQQLAFQIQDVFTQLSSGTNAAMIASQQLPQVAFAMTMIGEASAATGQKITGFKGALIGAAGFMTTGWGAAITGGILLLTTMIPLLTGTGNGHRDAARGADDQRTAEERLRDAILDSRRQLEESLRTNAEAIAQRRVLADLALREAENTRNATRARIESALADARILADATQGNGRESTAIAADQAQRRVASLQAQLAANDVELAAARQQSARSVTERGRAMSSPEGRIGIRFDVLQDQLEAQAAAMGMTDVELARRLDALRQQRERELQVVQEQEAAQRRLNDTRQTGGRISSADAAAMIRSAGGHVTSAGRPTWIREEVPGGPSSQERLYQRYRSGHGNLAARPGTGNHEYRNGSNALDITGLSLGQVRQIFEARGVRLTELLNEGDHIHAGWGRGGRGGGERRAETMARQSESRDVDIRGTLALAQAYLQSSTAAARAEAARQGLTEATRQGGDTSARVRQQLDIETAQVIATGARGVAQMREETAARADVNARLADGTLSVRDMQQQLDDEARLRPLLARQTLAQGDALRILNLTIDATREALRKLHEEEAHGRALVDIQQLSHANDNARATLGIQAPNDRERAVREAMLRGSQEAADRGYNWQDSAAYSAQRGNEEVLRQQGQAADQFRRMNADADDRVALLRAELSLGGIGEQQRARALAIEEQRLRLEREFGPEHRAEIEQILDKARAEQELQLQVERVRDAQREVEQVGGNVIDEIFNVDNWDNWGEAGKRVLHMLLQEMITLAAINPLKNMLFGEHNNTLGTIFSALGNIGGAVAGGSGGGAGLGHEFGHFAAGTAYASGGMAWVGENGREPVFLPRGSRVGTASEGRRMAANDGGMGPLSLTFHNDFRGADVEAVSAIQGRLDQFEREFPARVVGAMADARSRHVWRGQ